MCGLFAIAGSGRITNDLSGILDVQQHRGPDFSSTYFSSNNHVFLAHNRLKIIDLSDSANQPFNDPSGRYHIVFNGEIYNYIELRAELSSFYKFTTCSDTEVLLAAYMLWGSKCLDKLIGMFSFVIWDDTEEILFAARDRFGVKPLYYNFSNSTITLASEIKMFHSLKYGTSPDEITWSSYFRFGIYGHSNRTFFKDIQSLDPGHCILWKDGMIAVEAWYNLPEIISDSFLNVSEIDLADRYLSLLQDSVKLRFRSDVPVGVNLSGGLDSSILLNLAKLSCDNNSEIHVFTFTTNDPRYDELPWVRQMLKHTPHQLHICPLSSSEVPELALIVQNYQDEPFGGIPTLAYSKIFKKARSIGITVLLDGQGLDEQCAGYSYYNNILNPTGSNYRLNEVLIQGTSSSPIRPACLTEKFRSLSPLPAKPAPFPDALRNAQYKDTSFSKMPKALRFNDRVSMMHSTELRVPFLDHRLFEFAFRLQPEMKIRGNINKWLLRKLGASLLPPDIVEAPKRPVQTPQREWLRNDLSSWAKENISIALDSYGGNWFHSDMVLKEFSDYIENGADNSFYVWQWINLGLCIKAKGISS